MTVNEAIRQIQGKQAGMMNRYSAQYAQTLILPGETVTAAVVANIATPRERFPGIVVLTDRRVMAVCGLPGIKRSVTCDIHRLEKCEETPSALHYKATFSDGTNAFSLTVNPEIGEKFSRHIAVLKGEEEAFDAVEADTGHSIFNPTLLRNNLRKRQVRSKERAQRQAGQEAAQAQREAVRKERADRLASGAEEESAQDVAQRLARQLEEAKAKGQVDDTDPKAVAARLAAELAAEEARENTGNT